MTSSQQSKKHCHSRASGNRRPQSLETMHCCARVACNCAMALAQAPESSPWCARRHCMGRPHPRGTLAQIFAMSAEQACRSVWRAASTAALGAIARGEGRGQLLGTVCAATGALKTRSKAKGASAGRMSSSFMGQNLRCARIMRAAALTPWRGFRRGRDAQSPDTAPRNAGRS